jgi:hypothetical protein
VRGTARAIRRASDRETAALDVIGGDAGGDTPRPLAHALEVVEEFVGVEHRRRAEAIIPSASRPSV